MDEHRFHHELQSLKQRVSELATSHSHMACSPPAFRGDPLITQLDELRGYLNHSLNSIHRSLSNRAELLPRSATSASQYAHPRFLPVPANYNLTLPSGPLFWQLYNSLRMDMQGLDGRVAALEQSVSDLEDKFDSVDPRRFTPASSTCSKNDAACAFDLPEGTGQAARGPPPTVSELCSEDIVPRTAPTEHWVVAEPEALEFGQLGAGEPPLNESLCGNDPAGTLVADELLSSQDAAHGSVREAGEGLPDGPKDFLWEHRDLVTQRSGSQSVAADVASRRSESLKFRDKEIARLDEQLRVAHERLKASEFSNKQSVETVETLEKEIGHWQQQISLWRFENAALREELRTQTERTDAEERRAQKLRSTVDQLFKDLARLEAGKQQLDDQLRRITNTANINEFTIFEDRKAYHTKIDEMVSDHREELKKLQGFCESKDDVIQRQDKLLARGGGLLEERDNEISELRRLLRAAESDREHAFMVRARVERLLEERDRELEELKRDSGGAPVKKELETTEQGGHVNDGMSPAEPLSIENTPSPFAAVGNKTIAESPKEPEWRPGAMPAPHRLPHERRRAYVWEAEEDSDRLTRHVFGKPSVMLPGHGQRRRVTEGGARFEKPVYRYGPPRHLRQRSVSPTPSAKSAREAETTTLPPRRQRQESNIPLDRPPLPVRRMASDINMRRDSRDGSTLPERDLVKYRSMQSLPKRPLQPYVETEAESGGEMGGEV